MLQIPIQITTTDLALILSEYQDFVWLDSADGDGFSIMAFGASDVQTFDLNSSPESFTEFLNHKGETTLRLCNFATRRKTQSRKVAKSQSLDLIFTGGWIGYMSYEAYRFNPLIPFEPKFYKDYPLAVFRYYETFIYIDHKTQTKHFVSTSEKKWKEFDKLIRRDKPLCLSAPDHPYKISGQAQRVAPTSTVTKEKYATWFDRIKTSLSMGDYLELNATMEFECPFESASLPLYFNLRKTTQAPMMAYMQFPEVTILSASPERYFQIEQNKIATYPIKGTIHRSLDPKLDQLNKQKLLNSQKDQAELLMITDMLRNDLGRICKIGSVKAASIAELKTFSHYHHLISLIVGELREDVHLGDVFCALFPGGSITGAPKIKVMEQIQDIEKRARGVYTGAIGFISNNGCVDFNIPIRTMVIENAKDSLTTARTLTFATGGGIVADSDLEAEYEECYIKASGMIEAITNKGISPRLPLNKDKP